MEVKAPQSDVVPGTQEDMVFEPDPLVVLAPVVVEEVGVALLPVGKVCDDEVGEFVAVATLILVRMFLLPGVRDGETLPVTYIGCSL